MENEKELKKDEISLDLHGTVLDSLELFDMMEAELRCAGCGSSSRELHSIRGLKGLFCKG